MNFSSSVIDIQNSLLSWFIRKGRHWIPWKLNQNGALAEPGEVISPYRIWIAEVMLQQTQLSVVLPYWDRWMCIFPTLFDLAESDEQEILLAWQGLGYYSRAKRIYQSSKILINMIGINDILDFSAWPNEVEKWMLLPGIGRTTAGSIISSAFDLPTPILDVNVIRVISRLTAKQPITSNEKKILWELSSLLIASNSPRDFNQALMDLGSMVCKPKKPDCYLCPLKNYCIAYIKYDPIAFPKKTMKKIISSQEIGLGLIFNKDGELLIDQRLENSSMGGMWEFPGGKKYASESIEETIEREIKEEIGICVKVGKKLLSFEHLYTHKKLFFTVHICEWRSGIPQPLASQRLLWVPPERLLDFPFPAANTKIIYQLNKHLGIENKKL